MSIENCRFDVKKLQESITSTDSLNVLELQKHECELERLLDGLFHYSNSLFQSLCRYEAEPDNLLDQLNAELQQCAEDDIQTGLNDRVNEYEEQKDN